MSVLKKINNIPFSTFVIGSLALGLAPFSPPHLFEKIGMLFSGTLTKPIDIFDLFLHGAFPVLLLIKTAAYFYLKKKEAA